MIGTNRDLAAMRDAVEYELSRLRALKSLPGREADAAFIDRQISALSRERIALTAAIVNRRAEAAKDVVVFSRWVSGNGVLDRVVGGVSAQFPPVYAHQRSL